jgi:osmotically-inducible protein OsmY
MNIDQALKTELPYSHSLIKLTVSDGRATLEGDVEWSYQKERAEAAVRDVPGIKEVRNLITLRPSVDPAEIRRRIKDAFPRSAGSVRAWAERRGA